jgi:hypothetical protein
MSNSATIKYFGKATVEKAVANYFATYGTNEDVREDLMFMAVNFEDDFFQMVCDFIEK